jgi:hypothetical protein
MAAIICYREIQVAKICLSLQGMKERQAKKNIVK